MSIPGMARRYHSWVVGGAAAAAVWVGSGNSVALAEGKKKDDASPYFDPEALERGAKALREINASPHAKQVGGQRRFCGVTRAAAAAVTSWVTQIQITSTCTLHTVTHAGDRPDQAAGVDQAAGAQGKGGGVSGASGGTLQGDSPGATQHTQ